MASPRGEAAEERWLEAAIARSLGDAAEEAAHEAELLDVGPPGWAKPDAEPTIDSASQDDPEVRGGRRAARAIKLWSAPHCERPARIARDPRRIARDPRARRTPAIHRVIQNVPRRLHTRKKHRAMSRGTKV